jgi:flagellar motor component MotA
MMGLVAILKYFDPSGESKKLGSNLAVMLLCVADGLFLDLVVTLPLESLAKRRLVELE